MYQHNSKDDDYYKSLAPHIETDGEGGVFIRLKNSDFIGLSVEPLSKFLKLSLEKSALIMKEAIKVAVSSDIETAEQMTNILLTLVDILEDYEDVNTIESVDELLKDLSPRGVYSLLSPKDLSEILDVKMEFAVELFDAYQGVITNDDELERFLKFISDYLDKKYAGEIPLDARKKGIIQDSVLPFKEKELFDEQKITEILAQEAPIELRPESQILADKRQKYFTDARNAVSELLDVSLEDANIIISSADNLQEFLHLDDIKDAQTILETALEGNLAPLLEAVQMRADSLLDTQNTIQDVLAPEEASEEDSTSLESQSVQDQISPSENTGTREGENTTSSKEIEKQAVAEAKGETKSIAQKEESVTEARKETSPPSSSSESSKQEAPKEELPKTLEDTLRLCMEVRTRVTAKSLVEILHMWGTDISQSLARFIIEEGKYGGTEEEDKKRIISTDSLERMIADIAKKGGIRPFIKVYLQMVNEQVNNMFYGGSR